MLRTTSAIALALGLGAAAPAVAKEAEPAADAAAPVAAEPERAASPQAEDAPEGPQPRVGEWHVNVIAEDGLVQMVPLSVAEELCGPEATAGAGPGEMIDCPEVATDDADLEEFQ
jgi:hypothetical protein